MLSKFFWLAIAGAVGTLSRYLLGGIVHNFVDAEFPWGTLVVNIFGCFMAGFLWVILRDHLAIGGELRAILFIGFFGAFTTFSTVMLETMELMRAAEFAASFKNLLLNNVFGICCVVLGAAAAKAIKGG